MAYSFLLKLLMLDLKYNLLWLLLSRGSKDEVVTLRSNTDEAISLQLFIYVVLLFFENRKDGIKVRQASLIKINKKIYK